LPVSR